MRCLLVMFFLLLTLNAQAGWIDESGNSVPDTESRRSAGDFGAHIVLTADKDAFRSTWNNSTTPPQLSAIDSLRLGETVAAMLIFTGCAPNSSGVCDVVAEFSVEKPDGERIAAGGGPVWTGAPPAERFMQLGQASLAMEFEQTDPPGEYSITAEVKDQISGQILSVSAQLMLEP